MIKKILFLILLLAMILRVTGIYPGYHPNHDDEVNIYSQAINILKTGSIEELRYEYPPLPAYINFISFKFIFIPLSWLQYYANNFEKIFDGVFIPNLETNVLGDRDINAMYWSRTVTAIIGVGIVLLIYKIGEMLFNKNVGLISSFLVAINYRQILNSHFGLPDIYNAFFLCLALIFILRVWKEASFKNYLLAAIFCGLSFSTKYQFFSFVPFAVVHFYRVFEKNNWRDRLRILFSPEILIIPFIIALVFLILNPYFFVNFKIAKMQLSYAALKYRFGKDFFDFYPFSYLYKYGIGQITSILILIGLPFIFLKNNIKKGVILMSVIIPYFYYLIYLTGGGFYTRNFVSITPLVLIIPAVFLDKLLKFKKYVGICIFTILMIVVSYENLNKDYQVLANYTKPWNQSVLTNWISQNIPLNAHIAAHSSVVLPNDYYSSHVEYDLYPVFSVDEFKEEGADYAITNYESATNGFYWWMTQDTANSLKYWNKPIDILKQTYTGMAVDELEDFGIYSLTKPTFAPDANFLIAKLPDYKIENKTLIKDYNFEKSDNNWSKIGNNLTWENGSLLINNSGSSDSYVRWISPKISINSSGFQIDYKIKTEENGEDKRDGFIFVAFYKDEKQIGVRLSKRNDIYNKWIDGELIGEIPKETDYIQIGFQVYNSRMANVYLKDLKIYSADIINLNSQGVHHIDINQDVAFPISGENM